MGALSLVMACDRRPKGPLTPASSNPNAYQLVTGDDQEGHRSHWDGVFNKQTYVYGKEPASVLRDHVGLLPVGGRALELAMGEGRNAVFLAKKGFIVDGVDISEVALRKAKRLARENGVSITTINADLEQYQIRPEAYDVIVVIDYLQRSLVSQIKRGLKRGGVIIWEGMTEQQIKNAGGAGLRRDALLRAGELREFFREFETLHYLENNDGKRAKAELVARKP
jgi:2-polyprenyl-3-methyl-5-hydroxy-6-metoxy-1,4-benzoquinol methylase